MININFEKVNVEILILFFRILENNFEIRLGNVGVGWLVDLDIIGRFD